MEDLFYSPYLPISPRISPYLQADMEDLFFELADGNGGNGEMYISLSQLVTLCATLMGESAQQPRGNGGGAHARTSRAMLDEYLRAQYLRTRRGGGQDEFDFVGALEAYNAAVTWAHSGSNGGAHSSSNGSSSRPSSAGVTWAHSSSSAGSSHNKPKRPMTRPSKRAQR